jgi:hypothetical protein
MYTKIVEAVGQGCPMAYFQTKNPNLDKYFRVFQWKMLVCFTAIGPYLRPFLVYFAAIWYILRLFGIFFPVLVCCAKKNLATQLWAGACAFRLGTFK